MEESSPDASDAVGWYDGHAELIVERYESLASEKVNAWLVPFLPSQPALVLDVGAGSGRDPAWLLSLGHQVIAVGLTTACPDWKTFIGSDFRSISFCLTPSGRAWHRQTSGVLSVN